MNRWVDITFDCLPLRTVSRFDVPIDASPKYRAMCERIKAAIEHHGSHNAYYLYNAQCSFHLVNSDEMGLVQMSLEGTLLTGEDDSKAVSCDLQVELVRETCDWLTEPIVQWFSETVSHAVLVEFDRYIAAGDREKAVERIRRLQAESDAQGGFVGMYL